MAIWLLFSSSIQTFEFVTSPSSVYVWTCVQTARRIDTENDCHELWTRTLQAQTWTRCWLWESLQNKDNTDDMNQLCRVKPKTYRKKKEVQCKQGCLSFDETIKKNKNKKKAKPTTTKNKKLVNIQRHKAQIPTQSSPRSSIPYEERILFNIDLQFTTSPLWTSCYRAAVPSYKTSHRCVQSGRGVARIFQRGGHRGYSPDCHVDLHAHIN